MIDGDGLADDDLNVMVDLNRVKGGWFNQRALIITTILSPILSASAYQVERMWFKMYKIQGVSKHIKDFVEFSLIN